MPVWLDVLALMLIGFIFIIIEVLIIPGFGVAGVVGIIGMGVACYLAFTALSPLAGGVVTVSSLALIIAMFKLLPRTRMWQHMRLSLTQNKADGYQVARPELQALTGKTGTAVTMLRPSGTALIDDLRYDVITDGEFIEKDQRIIVKHVDGNRIIVEQHRS